MKKKEEDDCGCGKPLKINDPRRKNAGIKKKKKKKR
jgi:hypothetical protein